MADALQCVTVVYRVPPGDLADLVWGKPIFGALDADHGSSGYAVHVSDGDGNAVFCGIVAQHQPPQPPDLAARGCVLLRLVAHGVCVAPSQEPLTVGLAAPWNRNKGGAYVLGVQHDAPARYDKLYRLLVRSALLVAGS